MLKMQCMNESYKMRERGWGCCWLMQQGLVGKGLNGWCIEKAPLKQSKDKAVYMKAVDEHLIVIEILNYSVKYQIERTKYPGYQIMCLFYPPVAKIHASYL